MKCRAILDRILRHRSVHGKAMAPPAAINRDFPDEARTGMDVCAFAAF
jgi:hypothetical protein